MRESEREAKKERSMMINAIGHNYELRCHAEHIEFWNEDEWNN